MSFLPLADAECCDLSDIVDTEHYPLNDLADPGVIAPP